MIKITDYGKNVSCESSPLPGCSLGDLDFIACMRDALNHPQEQMYCSSDRDVIIADLGCEVLRINKFDKEGELTHHLYRLKMFHQFSQREGRLLSGKKLGDHFLKINAVLGYPGQNGEVCVCCFMEKAEKSLLELIMDESYSDRERSGDMRTLWDCVIKMHEKNFYHGDLKPGNLFCVNGTMIIGDYDECEGTDMYCLPFLLHLDPSDQIIRHFSTFPTFAKDRDEFAINMIEMEVKHRVHYQDVLTQRGLQFNTQELLDHLQGQDFKEIDSYGLRLSDYLDAIVDGREKELKNCRR